MARAPFLFPVGAAFHADNLVLHAQARAHRVDGFRGPLSIKTVLRGPVSWIAGGREMRVDRSTFLVLNDGDAYSMDIRAETPRETCCAFFQTDFVERVALDATTPPQASLDNPLRPAPRLEFLARMHNDAAILRQVQSLASRCERTLSPSGFEEDFLILAEKLARLYSEIAARIARIPAVKAATREELFRRAERAREYLHSHADQPVSLTQAAREACLSPYHFHRTFQSANGCTPHVYLTALRLDRARARLRSGDTVMQAAVDVGFSSAPSFSRLFRARYGVAPATLRRA